MSKSYLTYPKVIRNLSAIDLAFPANLPVSPESFGATAGTATPGEFQPNPNNAANGVVGTDGAYALAIDIIPTPIGGAAATIQVLAWDPVIVAGGSWIVALPPTVSPGAGPQRIMIATWASRWALVQLTVLGGGNSAVAIAALPVVSPP